MRKLSIVKKDIRFIYGDCIKLYKPTSFENKMIVDRYNIPIKLRYYNFFSKSQILKLLNIIR